MRLPRQSRPVLQLASAAALLVSCAVCGGAQAATATASATVITPISISTATQMDFGRFAHGAGGSVTVSTSSNRTASASGPILSSINSTPAAARFNITGDNDATFHITLSADTDLTDGGTNTMAFTPYSEVVMTTTPTDQTSGTVDNTTGTLSATGAAYIYVGGKITVGAAQVAALYSGTITCTVEYN